MTDYPCKPMTEQQIEDFLSDVRNATLGTNRPDGAPQLSTMWFLYEQGQIYIGFEARSAKNNNIQRDPRVCFCAGGVHPDSRNVTIYGTAKFIDNDDPRFDDISNRISARYNSANETDPNRVLIVIKPEKTVAMDYN